MCNSYINVGDTYGYLTVLKEVGKNKDNRKLWLCQCECGNKRKISSRYVKQGRKCGACGLDLDENNKVHNKYVFFDQYIIGYTSNGDKFYIDIDDYEIVYPYCWHKMNNGYICTKPGKEAILLHRLVTNAPKEMDVDHINHHTVDNRKSNLRICTRSNNMTNHKNVQCISGIQYIHYNKQCDKYQIRYKGKHYGLFNCIADANEELQAILKTNISEYTFSNCLHKNDIRTKLYIDLDGVVFNTIKTIVGLYNYDFQFYENFEYINWTDVDSYHFNECKCATNEDIDLYFNQPRFFENLYIMENAIEIINKLQKDYIITFVSMGHYANLLQKQVWINKNFSGCKFIGLNLADFSDKSHLDLSDGILIDDSSTNLINSNAKRKYVFGDIYSWNKDYTGARLHNWYEVLAELSLPD